MSKHFPVAAAVLFAVAYTSGCRTTGVPSASGAPAPASANSGEQQAVAKARADSARHPYTAADIHFMSAMISHHAQAIVMAEWAPTHGASAALQRLAERVVNAQRDEIATMQRWLRDRELPVPEASPTGMKMVMNGQEHEMLMPGMLTPAQMKELDQARGSDFDRLFLTFMIQHHRGAISMVKDLFATPGAAQDESVFKLASDVNIDQLTEVERMQKMLLAVTLGKPAP